MKFKKRIRLAHPDISASTRSGEDDVHRITFSANQLIFFNFFFLKIFKHVTDEKEKLSLKILLELN